MTPAAVSTIFRRGRDHHLLTAPWALSPLSPMSLLNGPFAFKAPAMPDTPRAAPVDVRVSGWAPRTTDGARPKSGKFTVPRSWPNTVASPLGTGYMLAMALATKLALALLLLGSAGFAYFGPVPRRRVGLGVRGGLLSAGVAGYAAAGAALATGGIVIGALALALAGELVCTAGWLSRGEPPPSDDDGDGGGGGGGGRRPKPPPTDWDAFERAFRRYARDHERPRV